MSVGRMPIDSTPNIGLTRIGSPRFATKAEMMTAVTTLMMSTTADATIVSRWPPKTVAIHDADELSGIRDMKIGEMRADENSIAVVRRADFEWQGMNGLELTTGAPVVGKMVIEIASDSDGEIDASRTVVRSRCETEIDLTGLLHVTDKIGLDDGTLRIVRMIGIVSPIAAIRVITDTAEMETSGVTDMADIVTVTPLIKVTMVIIEMTEIGISDITGTSGLTTASHFVTIADVIDTAVTETLGITDASDIVTVMPFVGGTIGTIDMAGIGSSVVTGPLDFTMVL